MTSSIFIRGYRLAFVALVGMQSFLICGAWIHSARRISHSRPTDRVRHADFALSASLEEEAERLKAAATKLRDEIERFESRKASIAEAERQEIQAAIDEKQAYVDRYSAVVPILKPDGRTEMEKVQFPPRLTDTESEILVFEAYLPLGLLLGESEELPGATIVDDVASGSNSEQSGVKVGDLLRGFTACRMEMTGPTWQLIAGGIGMPKTMRFMFSADNAKFEEVMEAVSSNRMDPEQRPVVIVVERPMK